MIDETSRWVVGGIVGIAITVLGAIVGLQSAVDAGQDDDISLVRFQTERTDDKHEAVFLDLAVKQQETAVALREVAATLKSIDERGTHAYLRSKDQ